MAWLTARLTWPADQGQHRLTREGRERASVVVVMMLMKMVMEMLKMEMVD